jgi:hypothetical protein
MTLIAISALSTSVHTSRYIFSTEMKNSFEGLKDLLHLPANTSVAKCVEAVRKAVEKAVVIEMSGQVNDALPSLCHFSLSYPYLHV